MPSREEQLDIGQRAIEGLLGEFRLGNIGQPSVEKVRLERHLGELSRVHHQYTVLPCLIT